MRSHRFGWMFGLIFCCLALPAFAAQSFNFECRADRIASGPLGTTLKEFHAPIRDAAGAGDSVEVIVEKHLPAGWTGSFCYDGECFLIDPETYVFSKHILLPTGVTTELLFDMAPSLDQTGSGYYDVTIRSIADPSDFARCTYAYFSGMPVPTGYKYTADCADNYFHQEVPPYPYVHEFRVPIKNTGTQNDSLIVRMWPHVNDPWFTQFCQTSTGICFDSLGTLIVEPGVNDTLRVDFYMFENAQIGYADLEIHDGTNPGLVTWCRFGAALWPSPVDAPDAAPVSDLGTVRVVPNPFRGQTTLELRTSGTAEGSLSIYSSDGRLVRSYPPVSVSPAGRSLVWDGRDDHGGSVPSGVYYYRFHSAAETLRGVLIRAR